MRWWACAHGVTAARWQASVAEAKVDHTWCNVRDVEGGDIKEHFDKVRADYFS